ncbi:mannitol operon transcriptional antiterminator [Cytobacillus eiseniae]|uniref:Mannitol operon transcriptional antiterminator n=1 Tax=Cytobacillus eiseniae TaxID=762947 RepID=A0ABS4RDP4_9BACI|nr:mannitol operon transcriptional antiterminator [Cytobacillus eiseniae]
MYISAREKMIIEALIREKEEMTIKELSKIIDVSARTIHRDLNSIKDFLESYQLTLVRKSGVGVQIVGDEDKKLELKKQLNIFTFREYTVDERQTMILCILYESTEPVKLYTLAQELRVSIATVSADLTKLEQQLKPLLLSVIKKRGYGVELSGTEKAKRRAISYWIAKTMKDEGLFALIKEQIQQQSSHHDNLISNRLMQLVDREKLFIIEEIMKDLQLDIQFTMTDSSYVSLMVHLGLALERIIVGESIELSEEYASQLKEEPEYPIAKKIIDKLKERFQVAIPDAEIGYITMHLQGAKLRKQEGILHEATHLDLYMQTSRFVQLMEEATGFRLTNNRSLIEGLMIHLKPAIYRLEQNMGIINPLLDEIKENYMELFEQVKGVTVKVFPAIHFPDEEIGYLVMHFGSAMLSMGEKGDLKAYIVCSSGIGTSKLLASRLQKEIQEIAEVINVSIFELDQLPISDRDLVISTIHLQDFHREYMIVSPLLTKDEIKQVQLYARRQILMKKPIPILKERKPMIDGMIKKMEEIHLYTGTIAEILSNFQYILLQDEQSPVECLESMCKMLEKEHIIQDAKLVAEALFAREAIGGIGISGTKLALYHTSNEHVSKPSFTLHRLIQPAVMKGMDGNDMEVRTLLLLLSPKPYYKEGVEVLSYISTVIIENEQSIYLFEKEEEKQVHSYLAKKFEQFILEKLN